MATFSPSPAPRRSSRLQNRATSPLRPQRTHRLAATPSFVHDSSSVSSAMDIDDRASIATDRSLSRMGGDVLFAKTDEMTVSLYANLPLEVKQVFRTSDFNKDPYSGEIDTTTGFALVASVQTCFVWQHAQATKGIPTCYIFSCPQDARSLRPPFHKLVPQGSSREPGLILVSADGQIRFWDSIGIGLAGGDNFVTSQLHDMEYNEEVTNLVRADPQTYILSTSYGSLYRLVLTSTGGKHHISVHIFARPAPTHTLSRLTAYFLPSASSTSILHSKDVTKHILAVAVGPASPTGDRDVWALANGHVQQWKLKSEGWEEPILDQDITPDVSASILRKNSANNRQQTCEDLELSDLTFLDDDNLAVLVSYSGKEGTIDDLRRLYALVELEFSGLSISVKSVKSVPYQTTSRPGPPVHPRIHPIYGGSVASVQFGDAVAIVSRVSEYRDRLELKAFNDRTFGLGVNLSSNSLVILTATSMIKASLDLEKIEAFTPETGHTNLVKSTMMQAILYGASPVNPLKFSFPPELNEEALMQGAEQLSQAVLKSDPEVVRQSPDMSIQLTGRKERLSWLIGFINENGVLAKMSRTSRQRLATDAEKLYASHQLWMTYNQFLSSSSTGSILKEAVVSLMSEMGNGHHEDVMRSFFRSHVGDIGKLLKKVADAVNLTAKSPSGNINNALTEANRIVATVLRSATQYRSYNLTVYGITLPMISPWTSKPSIIDAVLSLFNHTTKAVEPTPGQSACPTNQEPASQLPILAAALFQSVKERLDWLSNAGKEYERDLDELYQRFDILRPEVLETLRRCGHIESAFNLAEQYHDFASLVALCHRDTVYPSENNPNAERIESYVQLYKEDFTDQLFQWYIQHSEARTMFDQEARRGPYMDGYFKRRPNIAISWIRDIGKSDYGSAAHALLEDSTHATNLEAKHLMLSIGKLAYLAQSQEANMQAESEPILDAFNDNLDFVDVQDGLLKDYRAILTQSRLARQSLEGQIESVTKSQGRNLEDRPAFTQIFKDTLRQLLQGKTLSIEDTVDHLTLKDNSESIESYATALQVLTSAAKLPEARELSAYRTIWRRVYLYDDWESLLQTDGVPDEELTERLKNTALFVTLCSVLPNIKNYGLIIRPEEALMIPQKEEITSRWPGMSTEQVEELISDYTAEQDVLGEADISDAFGRVEELARAAEGLDPEDQ